MGIVGLIVKWYEIFVSYFIFYEYGSEQDVVENIGYGCVGGIVVGSNFDKVVQWYQLCGIE